MRVNLLLQSGMPPILRSLVAAAGFTLASAGAWGQDMTGAELLDFKALLENHSPPNEIRPKTTLEGAKAQPETGGRIALTGASLKTFSTNGALELVAESPQCVFDPALRTVSSPGLLLVRTADGRFQMQGEGFSLQASNSYLILSNRVYTVLRNAPGKSSKP